jgi:hypothetical protein
MNLVWVAFWAIFSQTHLVTLHLADFSQSLLFGQFHYSFFSSTF